MITETESVEKVLTPGCRPCPRCGQMMDATLDEMWQAEAEAAHQDWRDLRDTQDAVIASMRGF